MQTNGQKETEIRKVDVGMYNMGTVNKNKVTLSVNRKGTLTLYFSYETIVSFELNTSNKYMSETIKNYWSNTTGELLNECCSDHSKRLDEDTFKSKLTEAFNLLFGGSK